MHVRISAGRIMNARHTCVLSAMLSVVLSLSAGVPLVLTAAHAAHRAAEPIPDITDSIARLADLALTVHVNNYDPKELEKIGKDFARSYALRTLTLLFKQPDKMRLDGKSSVLGEAMLIQNGAIRYYSVPKLNLHNREDLKNSPSRRQSLLEYGGIVTPSTLAFMQAHYVQHDELEGVDTRVFDLTYKGTTAASSHFRVWIDSKTHVTLKRAWYDSEGKLKATFFYADPHEVSPGLWLPSHIEVKNAEGVTAATTTLEDPQVNQGLNDDLFNVTP